MNPYTEAPNHAFWSRAVSRVATSDVDPVCSPSFRITADTKVGTAGSCFAQHIARHMRRLGLQPFITEWPHAELRQWAEHFHYGIYSARYGNLYTARQASQLFLRAFGLFTPSEAPWRGRQGEYIDPFRPLIPEGFATLREFERDRERHFVAVRQLFRELDVFVFTLGLTEAWLSRDDGAVFPACPGTAAGIWDESRYRFHNFSVTDTVADLEKLIKAIRGVNQKAKFILTVSPVPLVATATGGHVLPSTIYSKSVLRVAAQEIADQHDGIDYFPSYEIITGPHADGYFEGDRRSVSEIGIAHVMRVFAKHYLQEANEFAQTSPQPAPGEAAGAGMQVICDEMYNDLRGP